MGSQLAEVIAENFHVEYQTVDWDLNEPWGEFFQLIPKQETLKAPEMLENTSSQSEFENLISDGIMERREL